MKTKKKKIVFKINNNEDSTGKIILDEKNIKILRGLDTEKENSLTVQNSKNATYNIQITKEKNLEVQDWLKRLDKKLSSSSNEDEKKKENKIEMMNRSTNRSRNNSNNSMSNNNSNSSNSK